MNRFIVVAFSLQTLGAGTHLHRSAQDNIRPSDRWFSPDKAQHFFLAAFVQSAGFSLTRATGVAKNPSLVIASGISASAIVAKEVWDRRGHGTPSAKDAIWGLAGAAAISPVLARTK